MYIYNYFLANPTCDGGSFYTTVAMVTTLQ